MSEYPENQNNAEKEQPKYAATVDALLKDFHDMPEGESASIKERIENFLLDTIDRTDEDAQERITSSRGEPYSRDALVAQFREYAITLDEGKPNARTIPGFDGLRAGVHRLANDPAIAGVFREALEEVIQAELADMAAAEDTTPEADEPDIDARAAIAAARLIEEGIEVHSEKVAEEEPRVTREEAEEIGEEALEATGVEEPLENRSESLHRSHETRVVELSEQVSDSLEHVRNALMEQEEIIRNGSQPLSERAAEATRLLGRAHDYPDDSVRTILSGSVEMLYELKAATLLNGAATAELERSLDGIAKTLREYTQYAETDDQNFKAVAAHDDIEVKQNTVMAVDLLRQTKRELGGVDVTHDSLQALNGALNGASDMLTTQIAQLQEIQQRSYDQPIDLDVLTEIARSIQATFTSDDLYEAFRAANVNVTRVEEQLGGAIHILRPNK